MRWRAALVFGLLLVVGAGVAGAAWPLPVVGTLPARVRARLARHGARYVPLADVPRTLQAAIVAAEDQRFYSDPGVDPLALARAAIADIQAGRIVQGGSTLTEELADVVLVHGDTTPLRRLTTMALALRIARTYSKARVLEMYFNAVYFGEGAYGVGRAAHVYFHRSVRTLDLSQSALLAGLPQAPSLYDPLRHPAAALSRSREVLAAMVETHAITRRAAVTAERRLAEWLSRRPRGDRTRSSSLRGCALPRVRALATAYDGDAVRWRLGRRASVAA
jgi:membrane peptidoglycan carboxypeptidase